MKIALFFPPFYSLKILFENTYREKGIEVVSTDFRDFYPKWKQKGYGYITTLPGKISKGFYNNYIAEINKEYLKFVGQHKPNFILMYNNCNLHPDTVDEIKKICPIYNYLGDYPLFLDNPFALETTMKCNHVFCPDSYWMGQLKNMGHNNVSFLITGYDKSINFSFEPSESDKEKYSSDLLFIGRGYKFSSYGYKRALFYNSFSNMDIKIYGREWENWFNYFPKLKQRYYPLKKRLSFEEVNTISNCCKIYPIDLNPGLINGLHIRIFDCIGAGILPLVEYSKDIDTVFKNVEIPIIKDYSAGLDIAKHYLSDDLERKKIINNLKDYVDSNYSAEIAVQKILRIYSGDEY